MPRGTIPKITWGAAFANTLRFGQPLDNAASFAEPREGSEWAESPAGARDAWLEGDNELLEGDVRWIPTTDTADPVATGWDGATGWAAFLAWARQMNTFRFFPDEALGTYIEAQLVEPKRGAPGLEEDGWRRLRLVLVSTGGTPFTGY